MLRLYLVSNKESALRTVKLLLSAACAMLVCGLVSPVQGWAQWTQLAEITASDGAAGDFFGSVAVDGSTAVVGAPTHIVGSNYRGAAYIFMRSGGAWIQQAELAASDAANDDGFGYSVAVRGTTAVVTATGHNGTGAAYVFVARGGTWTQQAELTPSDGAFQDFFGLSVAFSAGTIVVGAPYHQVGNNPRQGAAYVFARSGGTWTQRAELTASDGSAADLFGNDVAIDGSTVVVGVTNNRSYPGAAYVFARSGGTWTQQAELTASDGLAYDHFGQAVAISGSTAIVGSPCHPGSLFPCGRGAAYMFTETSGTWAQQAEVTASDEAAFDNFGESVAVSGCTTVVGSNHNSQGAVYVFTESNGTWSQKAELTASDGAPGDFFAIDDSYLAVSGSTVVVGAPLHMVGSAHGQGAAYVFGDTGFGERDRRRGCEAHESTDE